MFDAHEPGRALRLDVVCERSQSPRPGVEEHGKMRHALAGAPPPAARVVRADVSQPACAFGVACHAGEEFGRERLAQVGGDAQRTQALARECDMQRGIGQRIGRDCARNRSLRQPGARRARVLDSQQEETGFRQVPVPEPHQTLNVVQLHGTALARRSRHSSCSQASACASVMLARSNPSRMRWLRFRSASARPG